MKFLIRYFYLTTNLGLAMLSAKAFTSLDTTKAPAAKFILVKVEQFPAYPGGLKAFSKDIIQDLKYPEAAKLLGINGKIALSFVIDTIGKITEVTPLNCIGAGCEAEAVKALYHSKQWQPGRQDGKAVRVQYSIPLVFTYPKSKVSFRELRRSKYGFVFKIAGIEYLIDEAEKILGKSFYSSQIEIAEPYSDLEKFKELSGREIYLLQIK